MPRITRRAIMADYASYIEAAANLGRAESDVRERRMLETAVRRSFALLTADQRDKLAANSVDEMIENNLSRDAVVPDMLENMIAAAEQHGRDSEPDHACGDLQEYLREILKIVSLDTASSFFADPVIVSLMQQGLAAENAPAYTW